MWEDALAVVLVFYLPGPLLFRLPIAHRERRVALPPEERLFWQVVISVGVASTIVLTLAAIGWYRFDRLLWAAGSLSGLLALLARGRLRLGAAAAPIGWWAIAPAALALTAAWIVFQVPPAEYVMGGKDPGTYMNEGLQIAQRGSLTVVDPLVASVPPEFRDLFFPDFENSLYFSSRFMGFFLLDPEEGAVLGQFPHLYPAWIAIGYGIDGLSGARAIVGVWAVFGVLAVYFAGAWLVGRPAASAGAGLLAVHVAQVWYSRYPNAEIPMQALVFASVLAYSRASVDDDRFFAPVAASCVVLACFAHVTAVFAVAGLCGASLLGLFDGRRPQRAFLVPLIGAGAIAAAYYLLVMRPYAAQPLRLYGRLPGGPVAPVLAALAALAGTMWVAAHERIGPLLRRWIPWAFVATLWGLATYAYFFRAAAGRLAPHDAEALRVFTDFYLLPVGLAAAAVGLAVVAARSFWVGLPFLLTFGISCSFFFYKIRIIPEHFWAARRFVPVILPAALVLIGAAALLLPRMWPRPGPGGRWPRRGLHAAGLVLVVGLGSQYVSATSPIFRHVEYAGLISQLEQLAGHFGDADLVLVETRGASDMHVLALPLAYTYARNTLVLFRAAPDGEQFDRFLRWAKARYERVFFVGGGGTQLLSGSVHATPIASERFQIPEYEQAYRAYPTRVRHKEFDYGVYELVPGRVAVDRFDLDIGTMDDLHVRRFHAKEVHGSTQTTFRWTRDVSFVSLLGIGPDRRTLTIWLGDGGRPTSVPPATATITLDGRLLGTITATTVLEPYQFEIPVDLATTLEVSGEAAQLRIESTTWNPREVLDAPDDRDLGLMLDRLTVE